jgi:acylphosphatase
MIGARMVRVYGRVQGVSFRASARAEARRLGLTGFARNEADGAVAIEVEGEEPALDRFVAWCRVGPPAADVERVEAQPTAVQGHERFTIG